MRASRSRPTNGPAACVSPRGFELLVTFELEDGLPRWRWQIGDVVLERELAMAHGRPAVGVVHRLLRADRPVRLELTPLCTWRNVHGERFASGSPGVEQTSDGFVFENAFRVGGDGWSPGGDWYLGVRAREEAARGLNDREDVWAAGTFSSTIAPGESHEVTAAAAPFDEPLPRASAIVAAARERAADLVRRAGATDAVDAQLVLAADSFAIETAGRPTAVAGYPWFGEWSRDLMTSYEGLYLATKRADEGRDVLRTSAATVSEGMLANTADTGSLEFNTVDGTLWFLHALERHLASTGDADLGDELAPVVEQIIAAPPRRHPLRHRCRPGGRPPSARRRGRCTDVDGCAHRRRPGDRASRQARRGERALDPRARGRREHRAHGRVSGTRTPNSRRRRAARFASGSCDRTAAGSSTSSTAPAVTTRPSARTNSSRSPCRTPRWPARARRRVRPSTRAGGRC